MSASRSAPEDDQAAAVVAAAVDVLGSNVLAAYLYGSAVAGGLRWRSDLDLVVLLGRAMTPDERHQLVARLTPLSRFGQRPDAWRPVELTALALDDVRPWRYPPRHDFQYGEWMREELELGDAPTNATSNPDLAVLLTTVRETGRSLLGPPPAKLLDPVPADDLRRAMVDGLDDLLADLEGDERNVILTLARIWTTLATGAIRPKHEAAGWVLERLPPEHRPVLERARAIYLDQAPEEWGDLAGRIGPFVDYIVAEIRRVAAEA
ncbi:MAG TPA: aminoglycoside adenylyltransferase family protein [Candidatus Limnocylindria bacterium]|nr:aminoglycoside adenylyltransferase family protein [Candidatus Limnocylindria bacterium]